MAAGTRTECLGMTSPPKVTRQHDEDAQTVHRDALDELQTGNSVPAVDEEMADAGVSEQDAEASPPSNVKPVTLLESVTEKCGPAKGDVAILLDLDMMPGSAQFFRSETLSSRSTWFKEQLAEADMHDSHQQLRTILGGIRYFFVLGKDAVAAHTTGESKRWPMLGRVSLDYAVVSHGRDRQRRHEDAAPRKPHTRSTGDGPVKQEAVPDREQASVPVKTVKDVADAHIAFFQTLRGQRKFVEFIAPAPSGFDARNIESLAALGVDYGAMPAVKASLRDVFYSRMQELMTAVGKSPVAWLRLSLTLRDAIIYKEAAIHVVGALRPGALDAPSNTRTSGERMFWRNNKTVAKALEVKGLELRERRWIVDHALFQNTFLDDEDKPITIESNHEGFVMISLWRDWFSSQLSANDSHGLYNPNVANLYRTIERGGDAYLPVGEVIKRFTEQEIDTDDVINDLAMLKKYASEQVAPLLQTGLQYKDAAKLSYLTAVELTDEDVPWEKEADLEREE